MMPKDLKIRAVRPDFTDIVEIRMAYRGLRGELMVAQPLTFEMMQEHAFSVAPAISLDQTSAQALMDSLWDCGIRPTEGSGSAGAMAAVQKHLEDMRTLVFEKQ